MHARSHTAEPEIEPALAVLHETVSAEFEVQRARAAVHQRLFGDGGNVYIGRFRVLRRLGVGGMGEVYLCVDDTLEREVAVKRVFDRAGPEARGQLEREARALAKLSHDNVVQIYECGTHAGRSYLAMEYVQGQTLRQWLALRARPSVREVHARFMAAGRGLAAAHARGFVHRDFKPENVLVRAEDGKIKVADFGLAQALNLDTLDDEDGRLAGTVLYMAPEQLRGQSVDARSDQFSFCLAFYEGLWGEQPYEAREPRDRLRQIERGPKVPPGQSDLFRVLRRGLAPDPANRWPSMDELLLALARASEAPRRRRLWAGAAALALGTVASVYALRTPEACESPVDAVWNAAVRGRLERQVETLEPSHASISEQRLLASLDDWAHAWAQEHLRTCELPEGGDARSWARRSCYEAEATFVVELIAQVERGDAHTLARAVELGEELRRPEDCGRYLARLEVPPPPPDQEAEVERLRAEIERSRALRLLGRFEPALERARATDARARELQYLALEAEARAELAKSHDVAGHPQEAEQLYQHAIRLARRSELRELEAELRVERAELFVDDLRDPMQARELWFEAQTAQELVDASPRQRARLAFIAGRLAEFERELEQAQARYDEAISLAADAPELPYYLGARAALERDPSVKLQLRGRALEYGLEHFGPHHPRSARLLANYGAEEQAAGVDDEGRDELGRAAAIWVETLEPTHPDRATAELIFAENALARAELDAAERHAKEAARVLALQLPADQLEHADPTFLLAQVAAKRAQAEPERRQVLHGKAVDHAQRAAVLVEASPIGGLESYLRQIYELWHAELLSLGRETEAEALRERAQARAIAL